MLSENPTTMSATTANPSSLHDTSRSKAIEDVIEACLSHFDYEDATVLAEAYYARTKSERALYLLSQSLAQSRRWAETYHTLKGRGFHSAECRYLFAKSAFKTGRAGEAESVLRDPEQRMQVALHPVFNHSPSEPFAHLLLGMIVGETNRVEVAKVHLQDVLKLQPLLWRAVEKYCSCGGEDVRAAYNPEGQVAALGRAQTKQEFPLKTPENTQIPTAPKRVRAHPSAPTKKKTSTPIAAGTARRARGVQAVKCDSLETTRRSPRLLSAQENENSTSRYALRRPIHPASRPTPRIPTVAVPNTRACKILFEESPDVGIEDLEALKQDLKMRKAQPLSSVNSPNIDSPHLLSISTPDSAGAFGDEPMDLENSDPSEQEIKIEKLAEGSTDRDEVGETNKADGGRLAVDDIYRDIHDWFLLAAEAYEHLSRYRCIETLALLNAVSDPFETLPLMLELRARAHFEKADYKKASEVFQEVRRLHPRRVEGMEMYSTALWQSRDSHQLSALCAEMSSTARDKPQTWCVVGNCFSLEKKHEQAVEALERAIRLDSSFGYAYSLLGHELIDLNEPAKASQSFRKAIVHSPNDYRAWYGLGLVHFKEEQYSLAKMNIQRAIQINPSNIILLCQAAVIEQSLRNFDAAMQYLDRALQYAPNNVACRYHKARLLFDSGSYSKALNELTELKSLSPDEAHVFFLLGRVHRKLGNNHMALLNFSWATEIDPRGEQNTSALSADHVTYDDDPIEYSSEARNSSSF